jgi:hypothetical protein
MGRHDMKVMADPGPEGQMAAFRRFVGVERALLELLRAKLEEEERMLP